MLREIAEGIHVQQKILLMVQQKKPEVWQRGPIDNMPALLQPVAHALLQAREEVNEMVEGFPDGKLWQKPAGVASTGFHLQHLTGVLDRLFTYAKGESLNEEQLKALSVEGEALEGKKRATELVELFNAQVDKAINQLSVTSEQSLTEVRMVGRAKIPSTVIGLLFHAAEHTMRHVGQLYVTIKVIKDSVKTGL
ncbi:MAG: metal-dependent hydrolase [Segetibacter sp.]|nr:metal-dependent hydrolase [Segetibacter sp.]